MDNEQLINQAQTFYENSPDNNRFIYTTIGTEGEMEQGFKKSLLRLDSITSNKSLTKMSWNCDVLQDQNHMTTFVPTFNSGYLALSSRLMLTDEDLIKLVDDSKNKIGMDLLNFYQELSMLTNEDLELTFDRLILHAKTTAQYGRNMAEVELYELARIKLESGTVPLKEKEEKIKMLDSRLLRAKFNILAWEAKGLFDSGNYEEAGKCYIQAFDMGVFRGTHIVRMTAIPALAQAGKIEEAFVQLDLLANKFKLGGNASFIDDPLCEPLRGDSRWSELMDQLDINESHYR
jgi:hypothetical protein